MYSVLVTLSTSIDKLLLMDYYIHNVQIIVQKERIVIQNMSVSVNSRFAVLLGEKRMKISAVSRATGISRTTLTNLYYGNGQAISYDVLGKLCSFFKCGVGDILETASEEVTSA